VLREIRRYPVKSMLGEAITTAGITERGIAGDRVWAVVDEVSGLVASAKHPRKWSALLTAVSRALDEEATAVATDLPGVGVVESTDAECDDVLSAFIGRTVRLVRSVDTGSVIERADPDLERLLSSGEEVRLGGLARGTLAGASPPGTVFDYAPVHFIAAETARVLASREPDANLDVTRFRPNLVLELPGGPFVENTLVGRDLRIGATAVLRVIVPSPRCVVPTLRHGQLPRDANVLRAVARHNRPEIAGLGPRPCLGAYATVEHSGTLRVGDTVSVQ
jgi:uncharacterized protein YcbX